MSSRHETLTQRLWVVSEFPTSYSCPAMLACSILCHVATVDSN